MAVKKKTKAVKKLKVDSKKYEKKIRDELAKTKKSLEEHYKQLVKASGKDWAKESKKYRKKIKIQLDKAEKTTKALIKKKPEYAVVAASVVGVIVGAVLASLIKRKK